MQRNESSGYKSLPVFRFTFFEEKSVMRAKYFVSALAIVLACLPAAAHATDGTWTNTGTGDTTGTPWTTASNWQGGTVANGTDGNAYFNTLTLTNQVKIYIDANGGVQPIGNMYFGDNASTKHLWKIRETGSSTVDYLQLGVTSGSPTIDVASGVTFDYNNAYVALEGTQGFTKTSAGTMTWARGPTALRETFTLTAERCSLLASPAPPKARRRPRGFSATPRPATSTWLAGRVAGDGRVRDGNQYEHHAPGRHARFRRQQRQRQLY